MSIRTKGKNKVNMHLNISTDIVEPPRYCETLYRPFSKDMTFPSFPVIGTWELYLTDP